MSENGQYDVGYGKPPEHTRFQKGQSGNPKGRKKKPSSIQEFARQMLDEKVEVRLNGRVTKVPKAHLIVMRLVQDLLGENASARSRALKDLKEYVPDFHLPAPDEDSRTLSVEIIRPEYFGLPSDMTREENLAAAQWILERRKTQAAARRNKASIAPDPLDI